MVKDEEEDEWAMFGSDSDDDEDNDGIMMKDEIIVTVTKLCLQLNPLVSLTERVIGVAHQETMLLINKLQSKGFQVLTNSTCMSGSSPSASHCDIGIITFDHDDSAREIRKNIIPGGYLIMIIDNPTSWQEETSLSNAIWDVEHATTSIVEKKDNNKQQIIVYIQKRPCCINTQSCPWKPPSPTQEEYERRILAEATIAMSVQECESKKMNKISLERANQALIKHGFVVIKSLLNPTWCQKWGQAAVTDVELAIELLLQKHNINLLQPNTNDTRKSFSEMAMREDYRVDIRNGPTIQKLRSSQREQEKEYHSTMKKDIENDQPVVTDTQGSYKNEDGQLLRFHPDILQIVKAVLHPTSDEGLYKGNFGRWNFEGKGPDGSCPPIRIGPISAIVSFPGAADQAVHADTPHLYEHMDHLPPHYIHVFTPGLSYPTIKDEDGNSTGISHMGGTCFLHGSHSLSVTARITSDDDELKKCDEYYQRMIRPSLELGDVLLFDCRILHFGTANTTTSGGKRPLLYVNMTHSWFHDFKNWDQHESIFLDS